MMEHVIGKKVQKHGQDLPFYVFFGAPYWISLIVFPNDLGMKLPVSARQTEQAEIQVEHTLTEVPKALVEAAVLMSERINQAERDFQVSSEALKELL